MNSFSKNGSWRGLFKKEWTLWKMGVITLIILNFIVILAGPTISYWMFGVPQDFLRNTINIAGTWFVFNIFIGSGILLISLGHEMKRADLWLHSPQPIAQLVGVKVLFAGITVAFLLLLGGVLLSISFYSSKVGGPISLMDGALALVSVLIKLCLISFFVMIMSFFLWSIYQFLRSRMRSVAGLLTFILMFIGFYLWEKVRVSGVLDEIKSFIPVKFTDVTFYNELDSYFFMGIVPDGVVFTVGGILLYGGITAILFIVGSTLFEKKVRF